MKIRTMLPLAAAFTVLCAGSAFAGNQKIEKDGWTYIETEAKTGVSSFLVYKDTKDDKAFVAKCDAPGANALYIGFFGGSPGGGTMEDAQGYLSVDGGEPIPLPVSLDGSVAYLYDASSIAKAVTFLSNGKSFDFKATNASKKVNISLTMELTGFKAAEAWVAKNCNVKP